MCAYILKNEVVGHRTDGLQPKADESSSALGGAFKRAFVPDDLRRTRLGGVLRKHRMDGLPQVFNVLRGVGRQPFQPDKTTRYGHRTYAYLRAHRGLIGMGLPNGRNLTDYRGRTAYDYYYARHGSLKLHLLLLMTTMSRRSIALEGID